MFIEISRIFEYGCGVLFRHRVNLVRKVTSFGVYICLEKENLNMYFIGIELVLSILSTLVENELKWVA